MEAWIGAERRKEWHKMPVNRFIENCRPQAGIRSNLLIYCLFSGEALLRATGAGRTALAACRTNSHRPVRQRPAKKTECRVLSGLHFNFNIVLTGQQPAKREQIQKGV